MTTTGCTRLFILIRDLHIDMKHRTLIGALSFHFTLQVFLILIFADENVNNDFGCTTSIGPSIGDGIECTHTYIKWI